jgi:hypothetical protein
VERSVPAGYNHEGNRSLHSAVQLKDIKKQLPLRVLSMADWIHWTTWGFVVVPDAVPPENIERLAWLLWEFQEMDPHDPSSWTRPQLRDNQMTELNHTGMVEIYNHQGHDRPGEPESSQSRRQRLPRVHPLGL